MSVYDKKKPSLLDKHKALDAGDEVDESGRPANPKWDENAVIKANEERRDKAREEQAKAEVDGVKAQEERYAAKLKADLKEEKVEVKSKKKKK